MTNTTPLRKYFGDELAFYRQKTGLTQEGLAHETTYSIKSIQAYEQGVRPPSDDFCRRCDAVFGLDGVLTRLGKLVRADPSSWGDFRRYEQEATKIYMYQPLIFPGLLQTFDYAYEVIRATVPGADAKSAASDRMARQERLGGDSPPELHVIIDEAVLYREIGGTEIFRAQLLRVLAASPRTTVRILPYQNEAHSGLGGALTIAELPDGDRIAFADSQGDGGLIDTPESLARLSLVWDWVSAHAMPVGVSADWLRAILEDL